MVIRCFRVFLVIFGFISGKFYSYGVQTNQVISSSWNENENTDSSELGFRFYPHSFRSPSGYDVHQCALYCEKEPRLVCDILPPLGLVCDIVIFMI